MKLPKKCENYNYSGIHSNKVATDDTDITSTINKTTRIIKSLKERLWSKEIRKQRKITKHNTLFKRTLIYESETGRITKNAEKIEITEMAWFRQDNRISKLEKIGYEIIK